MSVLLTLLALKTQPSRLMSELASCQEGLGYFFCAGLQPSLVLELCTRGLYSETPEEISVIILALRQLEKELAEAPGPLLS